MTRWLLALPLVWHLSGLAGMAAVVCAPVPMPELCCCHHHGAAAQESRAVPSASIASTCPCRMERGTPVDPGTPTSAIVVARDLHAAPPVAPAPMWRADASAASLALSSADGTIDTSPPYLTAAPPRC